MLYERWTECHPIRLLRYALDLSLRDLEDQLGIPFYKIHRTERGRRPIEPGEIRLYSEAFQLPVGELTIAISQWLDLKRYSASESITAEFAANLFKDPEYVQRLVDRAREADEPTVSGPERSETT